jgi:UDP-N-acetylmuramoyl-tripeptide--D-alanyl-D-alanine ligase
VFANLDSAPLAAAVRGMPQRVIGYGLSPDAAVRPKRLEPLGEQGTRLEVEGFPPCRLALVGRHLAVNALAAFAVARELGLDPTRTVHALESYRPLQGRMEVRHDGGATLLVDYYNANPDSMKAALDVLATWPDARRRIAVLGDMLELGAGAAALHREVGAAVRDAELWAVGHHAADLVEGARSAGATATLMPDKPAAARALREALAPGVVVLLKASRGMALEHVLEGIGGEDA